MAFNTTRCSTWRLSCGVHSIPLLFVSQIVLSSFRKYHLLLNLKAKASKHHTEVTNADTCKQTRINTLICDLSWFHLWIWTEKPAVMLSYINIFNITTEVERSWEEVRCEWNDTILWGLFLRCGMHSVVDCELLADMECLCWQQLSFWTKCRFAEPADNFPEKDSFLEKKNHCFKYVVFLRKVVHDFQASSSAFSPKRECHHKKSSFSNLKSYGIYGSAWN